MLWDFLDYWCYESVPEIIWDSDVKKRNRKNPFKRVSITLPFSYTDTDITSGPYEEERH